MASTDISENLSRLANMENSCSSSSCKNATYAIAACIGAGVVLKLSMAWRKRQRILQTIDLKRKEREDALENLRLSLPTTQVALEKHGKILELDIDDLLKQLKFNKLRPIDVLEAYQSVMLRAQDETNCVTEVISDASAWARELESKPKGLLYGLPVALKDDFDVKGYDSTMGCAQFVGKAAKDDCVIVKALKAEGAIPFVKTNLPQAIISTETVNPVFGVTLNATDPTLSAGGSSGGIAALIALGGALVGGASDLGGSIRIPACFNGVCGFSPTHNRTSKQGCVTPIKFQEILQFSYGCISKTVAGSALYMKALWSGTMFKEDSLVPPIPFRQEIYTSPIPLKVGYFIESAGERGDFPLPPAYERAVLLAKKALERCGHKVVPFTLPHMEKVNHYIYLGLAGDGGKAFTDLLKEEIVDRRALKHIDTVLGLPSWLRTLLPYFIKVFSKGIFYSLVWGSGTCRTVGEWWTENNTKQEIVAEMLNAWKAEKLDGILCPGFGTHAVPVFKQPALAGTIHYTLAFNVMNCPSGVVPVTRVTAEDEEKATLLPARDVMEILHKKGMEKSVGIPIAVQCAALPYQDEVCLRLMADIERNVI